MAKKTDSKPDPLKSEVGKTFIGEHLKRAERDLVSGPDGLGWLNNETLRPKYEERAEFFRALWSLVISH